MPPFQLAKAQMTTDAVKGPLADPSRERGCQVCGCGCSMMLAGRSLNITVCGLLPAFWLFLSVTVTQCTFFPAKWWVEICQCSFHHSQAIIFSPVESDVAPTFGDMNEMKRWCFSKALGFSSKNIAVNLSYAQQMSSTTDKIVHGDPCYSMVNSTTITTVIVNSYSYDTRTIC